MKLSVACTLIDNDTRHHHHVLFPVREMRPYTRHHSGQHILTTVMTRIVVDMGKTTRAKSHFVLFCFILFCFVFCFVL